MTENRFVPHGPLAPDEIEKIKCVTCGKITAICQPWGEGADFTPRRHSDSTGNECRGSRMEGELITVKRNAREKKLGNVRALALEAKKNRLAAADQGRGMASEMSDMGEVVRLVNGLHKSAESAEDIIEKIRALLDANEVNCKTYEACGCGREHCQRCTLPNWMHELVNLLPPKGQPQ